jgi:hypothetical protein
VEIQLQLSGDGPPLEIVQDPLLNARFGIEEEFMGLDLGLSQTKTLVILGQMPGLLDRIGRSSPSPGFRLLNIKRRRVSYFSAEELAFVRIEGAAHGCSGGFTPVAKEYTPCAIWISAPTVPTPDW